MGGSRCSRHRLVIGSRRSRPNARSEIFGPGVLTPLVLRRVDHAEHALDQVLVES